MDVALLVSLLNKTQQLTSSTAALSAGSTAGFDPSGRTVVPCRQQNLNKNRTTPILELRS